MGVDLKMKGCILLWKLLSISGFPVVNIVRCWRDIFHSLVKSDLTDLTQFVGNILDPDDEDDDIDDMDDFWDAEYDCTDNFCSNAEDRLKPEGTAK